MRLRVEQATFEQPILFIWASGGDFEVFETALDDDHTVANSMQLKDIGDQQLYRIQIAEQADIVLYPTNLEVGASLLAVTATEHEIDLRMRFPEQAAFGRF